MRWLLALLFFSTPLWAPAPTIIVTGIKLELKTPAGTHLFHDAQIEISDKKIEVFIPALNERVALSETTGMVLRELFLEPRSQVWVMSTGHDPEGRFEDGSVGTFDGVNWIAIKIENGRQRELFSANFRNRALIGLDGIQGSRENHFEYTFGNIRPYRLATVEELGGQPIEWVGILNLPQEVAPSQIHILDTFSRGGNTFFRVALQSDLLEILAGRPHRLRVYEIRAELITGIQRPHLQLVRQIWGLLQEFDNQSTEPADTKVEILRMMPEVLREGKAVFTNHFAPVAEIPFERSRARDLPMLQLQLAAWLNSHPAVNPDTLSARGTDGATETNVYGCSRLLHSLN